MFLVAVISLLFPLEEGDAGATPPPPVVLYIMTDCEAECEQTGSH